MGQNKILIFFLGGWTVCYQDKKQQLKFIIVWLACSPWHC